MDVANVRIGWSKEGHWDWEAIHLGQIVASGSGPWYYEINDIDLIAFVARKVENKLWGSELRLSSYAEYEVSD